ncbi:hypothetical protein HY612_00820 [Candidatus Roizmanbacteria bacterium]|nr:hypothetical protein [Candidatus Roizmanbacteria bacterium]
MTKKNSKDVIEIFSNLKKALGAKPPIEKMYDEIRMMRFKIKPISGNISLLQFKNQRLIETLWSLGKLDEVFQREYRKLSVDQKEVFFRLFDSLYQQFQDQLNKTDINPEVKSNLPQVLEMEIFKEISTKKKVN